MAHPNIDQLKDHRAALLACDNFYDFQRTQIRFIDLLIELLEKEEEEMRDYARTLLGINR